MSAPRTDRTGRRRGLAVLFAALALLLPAAVAAPSAALAADVSFSAPEAKATYGESIRFTVDVTAGAPLERIELRLRFPDSLGPYIVDVPAPAGPGTHALSYVFDLTGGGHLVPNTTIEATWAAFTDARTEPVLSRELTVRYTDTDHDWRTVKGDLVRVHWYEGGRAFAEKALRIGDAAVRDTAERLGVTETEPIDFFIYGDEASFRSALGPGTRENVGGQAHSDIRTLFALITPADIDAPWVGIVVPHELVHLVFDTAVRNPYRFPPRWLNEGLAVYLSEGFTNDDRNRVQGAARSDELIPLVALGGQFPTDSDRTYLAYAESVSAIDYLVRSQGEPALFALVAAYADGLTDDEAFERATGDDLAAFQAGWLADLGADDPVRYGPQPAPAGPLPPGWTGPAPTSAPAATPGSAATPGAVTPAPGEAVDVPGPPAAVPQAVLLALAGLVVVGAIVGVAVARRRRATG